MSRKVILVDDHAVVRDGLRFMLERAGWQVVAECSDGAQAAETVGSTPCDLLILDLNLPGQDGLAILSAIRGRWPGLPILVLSMVADRAGVVRALRAGANGYATKSASRDELLTAMAAVQAGGSYLDRRVAAAVMEEIGQPSRPSCSEREVVLLGLLAEGLNNQQIAHRMNLSLSSIKLHLSDLFVRLGVRDRVSLVVAAMERGLIPRDQRPRPNR